jgi:hypothetical protein
MLAQTTVVPVQFLEGGPPPGSGIVSTLAPNSKSLHLITKGIDFQLKSTKTFESFEQHEFHPALDRAQSIQDP